MAAEFKDYYALLGVANDASAEEVKQAYRRLAKQHHPDLHADKDKDQAERRFKEINEAYEVLSDPARRAKYDRLGPGWRAPEEPAPQRPPRGPEPPGAESFEGFSEFFGSLFGAGGPGFAAGGRAGPRRGRDVEAELSVSLEDALAGGERRLSLEVPVSCPACRGAGRQGPRFCPTCGGVGETRRARDITAHLPAGVRDGTRLRLRGQGGAAADGGEPGDLFLRVRLAPHPDYKVLGSDLETAVTAMPWEAALGGEVSVPTPQGPIRVRIPAGTHAGRRLRLAGKGLGKEGGGRGDLYAVVRVDIPARADERIERIYRELREAAS